MANAPPSSAVGRFSTFLNFLDDVKDREQWLYVDILWQDTRFFDILSKNELYHTIYFE